MAQETAGTEQQLSGMDAAAKVFEGLLSQTEDTEDRETSTEAKGAEETPETTDGGTEESQTDETSPDESAEETEGEQDAGTESDEEKPEPPQTYKVKVDGQDVEVTLDELQKGYSRTKDYTQKTQTLSEQRKQYEAEAATVRQQRAQYSEALKQVEEAMTALAPQEPDWDKVRKDHPTEFPTMWADWQQFREKMTAVQAERARVSKAQADDFQTQRTGYLAKEREQLLEAIPEWKDGTKAKAERESLVGFLQKSGIPDEMISRVEDHRVVVILRKAMMYALDRQGMADELEGLAYLAIEAEDARRAVQFFGAATALRERIGAPRPAIQQASYTEPAKDEAAPVKEKLPVPREGL